MRLAQSDLQQRYVGILVRLLEHDEEEPGFMLHRADDVVPGEVPG